MQHKPTSGTEPIPASSNVDQTTVPPVLCYRQVSQREGHGRKIYANDAYKTPLVYTHTLTKIDKAARLQHWNERMQHLFTQQSY